MTTLRRNAERDFHGETRFNESHVSTTDPASPSVPQGRRQGEPAVLHGHALMENRNGLVVSGALSRASGTAEREAALEMLGWHRSGQHRPGGRRITPKRITLGADKAPDGL